MTSLATPITIAPCSHTKAQHVLLHPLCKNQKLIDKIVNVALHILVLGTLLAINIPPVLVLAVPITTYIFSRYFPQKKKPREIYPQIGQDAIKFARQKLKENPTLAAYKFKFHWEEIHFSEYPPVNKEIALLFTLHMKCVQDFMNILIDKKDNPWANEAVVKTADTYMKVSYAISCLTLEDLKPFTKKLAKKEKQFRSYAEALTRQDSYQYKTSYHCASAYHLLRAATQWNEEKKRLFKCESACIPEAYSSLFYQAGTVQNQWNSLYNDYCKRLRLYVSEDQYNNPRLFNWTNEDTCKETFESTPDTQPTFIGIED